MTETESLLVPILTRCPISIPDAAKAMGKPNVRHTRTVINRMLEKGVVSLATKGHPSKYFMSERQKQKLATKPKQKPSKAVVSSLEKLFI